VKKRKIISAYEHSTYKYISKNTLFIKLGFAFNEVYYEDKRSDLCCLLIYLLTELSSRQLRSHSRISQHFIEHKGSIPSSQEHSTGPYPEPYQSNPHHPIISLQDPFYYCPPWSDLYIMYKIILINKKLQIWPKVRNFEAISNNFNAVSVLNILFTRK
jgi:hypothetical protein